MLKLIKCEFQKFKRKKLFWGAALTAFIFPVFNALLLVNGDFADIMIGVREESGFLLLIPLLVVMAAYLFFTEQDNDTLKNLACIPLSKRQLVIAKVSVMLIFSVCYMLIGWAISVGLAVIQGTALTEFSLQLLLTIGTGVLLWAATLPCVVLVVWFNKSYIISVIMAFFYTLLNFSLHLSDTIMMKPFGLNLGTLMPIPMIFRWLYQYNKPDGTLMIEFFNRFRPYFAPPALCFGVLLIEAVVCIWFIMKIYQRQEI